MADKNTLELRIKVLVAEAQKNVRDMAGSIKNLAGEMRTSAPETKALAGEMKKMETAVKSAASQAVLFGGSVKTLAQQQAALRQGITALVDAGLKPESREIADLTRQYQTLSEEMSRAEAQTGGGAQAFTQMAGAIRQTASAALLLKGLDLVRDLGGFALAQADAFQTARNELGTLLGDMEAGAGLFNRIKAFNDKTPFGLDTTMQAAKVLLAADTPLAQINERLALFGDLSQGNAQRFSGFVSAFSKGAAKGQVDMEVLNTYLDQGVPILAELGRGFDATKNEVADMVSQGKVSFEDFSAALERLGAEGGSYFGGMERGSRSLAAMQEGLREATASLAASFGAMLLPAAIGVVKILTDMTNAINESPLAKGLLAGALTAVIGLLGALAVQQTIATVKTWLQYAALTGLNAALALTNPLLIAGIAAVAAATTAAVAYAAIQQKAARETEELALQQREQRDALNDSAEALRNYSQALKEMSDTALESAVFSLREEIDATEKSIGNLASVYHLVTTGNREDLAAYWSGLIDRERENLDRARADLTAAMAETGERQTAWIDTLFGNTPAGKLEKINDQLATARRYLADPALSGANQAKLPEIIRGLEAELARLVRTGGEADDLAAKWKTAWAEVWKQFQAERSRDPFAAIELERDKKLADAREHYIRDGNQETIDQVNAYYNARRTETAEKLLREEARRIRELSETRVDDLEYERAEALESLRVLEAQRLIAAGASEQDIGTIRARYAALRADTEKSFDKQIADARIEEARRVREAEENALRDAHTLRMETYQKEWEYRRELARRQVEIGSAGGQGNAAGIAAAAGGALRFGAADFMAQAASSQFGQVAAGGNPLLVFVKALVEAVMELENMKKLLNWAKTIVGKMFEIIGPMINRSLAPLADLLEDVGHALGQILAPFAGFAALLAGLQSLVMRFFNEPLMMLGRAFEWLYTVVIAPFGNMIIDMANGLIDLLNKIPGFDIKKIEQLALIGDAAEAMAEEMNKQKERITALYERQKDRVRDELDAQISSIRQQYELGLISRQQYQARAEQYYDASQEALLTIEEEMNQHLKKIEENTGAALYGEEVIASAPVNPPSAPPEITIDPPDITRAPPVYGEGGSPQKGPLQYAAEGIGNAVGKAWNWVVNGIGDLFGFDTGTPYVPRDMSARIHQGEGIIPRTFNEGIRRGDYALVGGGTPVSGGGAAITVNLYVEGSVIKKDDLVEEIYDGIAGGISSGRLSPLPA